MVEILNCDYGLFEGEKGAIVDFEVDEENVFYQVSCTPEDCWYMQSELKVI